MTSASVPARAVSNGEWTVNDVRGQYSDGNTHADLYRYLGQWLDTGMYLNVGYSRFWPLHLRTGSNLRLIDRMATGLLSAHASSPPNGDRTLLDIGSGRGGPAIRAHTRFGLDVVGVDVTAHNVGESTANAKRHGAWPQVRFQFGDACRLPFADASFSMAWSIESPAHFPDKVGFLREMARVLKPGGVAAFSDLAVVDELATATEENRRIYREFLSVWDVPYLETVESYLAAIDRAGFDIYRSEVITKRNLDIYRFYCGLFLFACRWQAQYERYRRNLCERTGANLDNVLNHVELSHRALKRGMIDYPVFWLVRR